MHKTDEVEIKENSEINTKLIDYLIDNTSRNKEGRLVMPLLWNSRSNHLLAHNMNLAKTILDSNRKKLIRDGNIKLVDDAIKEQVSMGFVERISDLENYLEQYPDYSFLPHMPIIKPERESTKCRVVFLSNMCQKDLDKPRSISHNQAMYSGPCLNQKTDYFVTFTQI